MYKEVPRGLDLFRLENQQSEDAEKMELDSSQEYAVTGQRQ